MNSTNDLQLPRCTQLVPPGTIPRFLPRPERPELPQRPDNPGRSAVTPEELNLDGRRHGQTCREQENNVSNRQDLQVDRDLMVAIRNAMARCFS